MTTLLLYYIMQWAHAPSGAGSRDYTLQNSRILRPVHRNPTSGGEDHREDWVPEVDSGDSVTLHCVRLCSSREVELVAVLDLLDLHGPTDVKRVHSSS
eukprot:COSAG02_NODE_2991_length_7607_cov_1.980021_3_plen_98_part_00